MAISTYKVFLMMKAEGGTTYEKLVDIKDYSDLGGPPEMLDATTMSDRAKVYVPGIQSTEALTFTANYTKADFTKLTALEGKENEFSMWFGGTEAAGKVTPNGSEGKFNFKGQLSVYLVGGGVNEVVDMTITIAPSTPITMDTEAA